MRNKSQKAIISFSSCSQKKLKSRKSRDNSGQFPHDQLTCKGQLFIVANASSRQNESCEASEMAVNILNEVYYSDPSEDVITSLMQAFQDANTVIHELFNTNGQKHKFGVSCTALVLTKEWIYIAQIGNGQAYHITPQKVEKITCNNKTNGRDRRSIPLIKKESKLPPTPSPQSYPLGLEANINININRDTPVKTGDCFLLCTDGLVEVNHQKIKNIVLSSTPQQASRKLIKMVDTYGRNQNMNVQVIRINSAPRKSFVSNFTKAAITKNLIWFLHAAFFLLILLALYQLSHKRQNGIGEQLNQPVLQKAEVLANLVNSSMLKNAEEPKVETALADSERMNTEPERLNSENDKPSAGDTYIVSGNKNKTVGARSNRQLLTKRNAINYDGLEIFTGMLTDAWDFTSLTDEDFNVKDGKLTFLNSAKRKKALHQTEFSDLSIQVKARVMVSDLKGRFGIILGYNLMNSRPYETFYLFSVHKQNQFLLQKFSNFKKELLVTIPAKVDSMDDLSNVQLKATIYGPYLELFVNQKRIYVWQDEKDIRGRVGFYVDPNIQVEFSDFKTCNTSYLKKLTSHSKKVRMTN